MQGKSLTIETLRGVAIILLIVDHIIGSTPDGGMKLEYPSLFRYVYLHNSFIVIPLYTAIAGWVYLNKQSFIPFLQKRFIRLMLPAFFVGTLYFVMQNIVPGTNMKHGFSDILDIYIYPYTMFWFLPSLFLIQLLHFFVEKIGILKKTYSFILLLTGAYIMRQIAISGLLYDIPNLFSFQGALAIYFYFLIGVACRVYTKELNGKIFKSLSIVSVFASIVFLQIIWFYFNNKNTQLENILSSLLVSGVLVFLLNSRLKVKSLVFLGVYSYGLYLFHGFGTSAGRILLRNLDVTSELVIFLFSFFLSFVSSILAVKIFQKWKVTNLIFLGSKQ